jgi:anti-sigma regulatory factor (Ser/Thr protein kinase)
MVDHTTWPDLTKSEMDTLDGIAQTGMCLATTTRQSVEDWILALAELRSNDRCNGPSFLRPFHIATLAAEMRVRGQPVEIPPKMVAYAARMHLWQAVGATSPKEVRENSPAGHFLPLRPLRNQDDVDETAVDLARIVEHQSGGQSSVESVEVALTELLNNCFDHSEQEGDNFGLTCAQAWPRGSLAQVAIVDTGVGIRQTLGANRALSERLASENACQLATEYGVSGKLGKGHSGFGLTLANDILRQNGGRLAVVSGYELYFSGPNERRSVRLVHPWRGTVVIFEWRTDRDLSSRAVYANWPDSEIE